MKPLFIDRRFWVLASCLAALSAAFWLSSRYPALDAKAMMAGMLQMDDGLSFDARIKHSVGEGWLANIAITFVNWINTNKQGMVFGLAFAAVIMPIIPILKSRVSVTQNGLSAAVTGFVFGAPLGVCTNCAAPIAYGLYQRGTRLETAAATMISSPVFNIVAITMLFNLFPFYVAAIKLLLTLLAIVVCLPLLVRFFPAEKYSMEAVSNDACERTQGDQSASELPQSWLGALLWSVKQIALNVVYLVKKVVPIMLLAGLMGSVVVVLVPWESLIELVGIQNKLVILVSLLGVALMGLFMPVPITFDIILCATLLSAGLPIKYVATLLFVLGSFSIYSFMVLWKAGARRVALGIFLSLALIGAGFGVLSHYVNAHYEKQLQADIYSRLLGDDVKAHVVTEPEPSLKHMPLASEPLWQHTEHPSIDYVAFSARGEKQEWSMEKVMDSGFASHPKPLLYRSVLPYTYMQSLAAGDVNNDGWPDIAVASMHGITLYVNQQGQFASVQLPDYLDADAVSAIALVDFDNDGWLDLFFSVARYGDFVSYNRNGLFERPMELSSYRNRSVFTTSVGFADLDRNGELDVVLGRQAGASGGTVPDQDSANVILMQYDGRFEAETVPGKPGTTLTLLLSDLNSDGFIDMMIGNDFTEPDYYFWNTDGKDESERWQTWNSEVLPLTTTTTMSLDSADINNDLKLDTYHAQVSRNSASPPFQVQQLSHRDQYLAQCENESETLSCQQAKAKMIMNDGAVTGCLDLPEAQLYDCIAAYVFNVHSVKGHKRFANYFEQYSPELASHYRDVTSKSLKQGRGKAVAVSGELPQMRQKNLLYQQGGEGQTVIFEQQPKALGTDVAGWSWNARFADYDGDQWQDLFVVNGWYALDVITENVLYHSQRGQSFVNVSKRLGLDDFSITYSFVNVDYDMDGDIDIVTFDNDGIITIYKNNETHNNYMSISLVDMLGNREAVGSRVTVYYGDGLSQVREVKASGGFKSHDVHSVHFGLGVETVVDVVEVQWSTGEVSKFKLPLNVGKHYRIVRKLKQENIVSNNKWIK